MNKSIRPLPLSSRHQVSLKIIHKNLYIEPNCYPRLKSNLESFRYGPQTDFDDLVIPVLDFYF